MPRIAKKTAERISAGIKNYQPILKKALQRDVNKSDTCIIVVDMLNEILGYDKYKEVTNEFFIGNTFCDIAVKIEETLSLLIEVKAIGFPLKKEHIGKVRSFARKKGIKYTLLTNGIEWLLFETDMNKKRQSSAALKIDFFELKNDSKPDIEKLYTISKDGIKKSFLRDYKEKQDTLNRYVIGAVMLSENFSDLLKKELRKLSSYHDFDDNEIRDILKREVIKREIIDNLGVKKAVKKIKDANYGNKKDRRTNKPITTPSKISDKSVNLDALK